MVNRTGVKEGDTVLITGASGGVGAAAIQLVICNSAITFQKKSRKMGNTFSS
jgi:NADPH-dependent curcumin reductase CurA